MLILAIIDINFSLEKKGTTMRLQFRFKVNKLPILYRHRFMALIKEAISNQDIRYKKLLYPDKKAVFSKVVKPFTFAVVFPKNKKIKKEKIQIDESTFIEDSVFYFPADSYISFFMSSFDLEFMINLYNGLLELSSFDFGGGIILHHQRTHLIKEKKINSNEVIFKTLSPILIESKDGTPLLPIDGQLDDFNLHFNEIHKRIFKDIRGKEPMEEFYLEPILIKKTVVKHTLKGFREQTGKPYMMLTCFDGCFKLKGNPEDLQLLYQAGAGLRTGQGFGMVEVV